MARTKKVIVLDVPKDSSKHERQERLKVVRTDAAGVIVPEKKAEEVTREKATRIKKVATPKVKLTAVRRLLVVQSSLLVARSISRQQ